MVIPRERRRKMSVSPSINSPRSDGGSPNGLDMADSSQRAEVVSILSIVKQAEDSVDAVVEYLVNNGADINAQDKYGMSPLHHSAMRGNKKAMLRLLSSPGIIKEPRDAQDSTPLHLAATYNQPSIARILLNEGNANPRSLDSDLRTPLHEACQVTPWVYYCLSVLYLLPNQRS
jgi:ankyrin repeat protein